MTILELTEIFFTGEYRPQIHKPAIVLFKGKYYPVAEMRMEDGSEPVMVVDHSQELEPHYAEDDAQVSLDDIWSGHI